VGLGTPRSLDMAWHDVQWHVNLKPSTPFSYDQQAHSREFGVRLQALTDDWVYNYFRHRNACMRFSIFESMHRLINRRS